MKVELVTKSVGNGRYENLTNEEIIAAVARHGTIKKDKGRLVVYLMDHKHWSPLQHVTFGFRIETRRSISAQIFRHRSLHGQEWSLRYDEPVGIEMIDLRKEHPTNRQSSTESVGHLLVDKDAWSFSGSASPEEYEAIYKAGVALRAVDEAYNALIEAGFAKECARDILPLATKTTIHITGNLRDLLGFLNVRCDEHAQKEIRDIATRIGEILEQEIPNIMSKIDWRNGLFM